MKKERRRREAYVTVCVAVCDVESYTSTSTTIEAVVVIDALMLMVSGVIR